ncbi:cytochrome bc complex cytochrome b subunit [Halorutilales archaeon Cl-col2-1]
MKREDLPDHSDWIRDKEKELSTFESGYLRSLAYLDKRLGLVDYMETMENLYYKTYLQLPTSHTQQYELDNKFWYWYPLYALGSFSILAYLFAAVTGAILGLYYAPGAEGATGAVTQAYSSISFIMTELNFGLFLRSLHRWSAQIMVAAVFLHMLRVYFTGAYKEPREINWLIGIILISLTMVFGYSGYLLPWDQLSVWASQIGVEMALSIPVIGEWTAQLLFGGFTPSGSTLMRMYILHVFLLPLAVTGLIAVHVWIVWVQGIAEPH